MPYYRLTMTLCVVGLLEQVVSLVLYVQTDYYYFLEQTLGITIVSAIEIVLVQSHMNYIDNVHHAKVELARDRQILLQYRNRRNRSRDVVLSHIFDSKNEPIDV